MSSEGVPDFIPRVLLGIYKINKDVVDPVFGTEGSACFDLFCNFDENTKIKTYSSTNVKENIQEEKRKEKEDVQRKSAEDVVKMQQNYDDEYI